MKKIRAKKIFMRPKENSPTKKAIIVRLSVQLHRMFRIHLINHDIGMNEAILQMIEEEVKKGENSTLKHIPISRGINGPYSTKKKNV